MDELDKLINLKKQYDPIAEETGLIDIGVNKIHLSLKNFLDFFSDYRIKERERSRFPFQLEAKYDHTIFFSLASANEMEKITGNKPDTAEIYRDENGDDLI